MFILAKARSAARNVRDLQQMVDVGFLGCSFATLVDVPQRRRIGSLQDHDPIFHLPPHA